MVRAVAKLSAECDAPDLTPECPYFERMADGSPVCGEQCQDLLARYPADQADADRLGLGGGLSASRRTRPRRGPDPGERAYDAGQVRLEDRGKPLSEQRIGALLGVLRSRAVGDLDSQDESPLSAVLDELEHRGDRKSVV